MFKPSCNYSELRNYNAAPVANDYNSATMSAPQPTGQQAQPRGQYVVPNWPQIQYNTLMHGNNDLGCSGYFGIQRAYPNAANCVTDYKYSKCN
jgi:hypothetical protein